MIYSKDDNTIKPISDFEFDKSYKNLFNVYYQNSGTIYYLDETKTPYEITGTELNKNTITLADTTISLYRDSIHSKVLKINCFNNGLLASVDSNCCSVGDQFMLKSTLYYL